MLVQVLAMTVMQPWGGSPAQPARSAAQSVATWDWMLGNVGVYGRGGASGIAYAASKAALIAVTKGIAHEGAPHVTANCILPGPTSTDHPNDREEPVEVVEGTEPNVTRTNIVVWAALLR